jgi:hypothetical protein
MKKTIKHKVENNDFLKIKREITDFFFKKN